MPLKTIAIESAKRIKYIVVFFLLNAGSTFAISSGSGCTNIKQQTVIMLIDKIKGGAIIFINSRVGILNFV